MPKGYGLCLGLNAVDPKHYDGWSGRLAGCENDAKGMAALLRSKKYESVDVLLTNAATSGAFFKQLDILAKLAHEGDIVTITSSSHGGQTRDYDGDEFDGRDETICLWDRQVLDDELEQAWGEFRAGVRIIWVSDSCHSGTMVRALGNAEPVGSKAMPAQLAESVDRTHEALYRTVSLRAVSKQPIKAHVLGFGACQDNQTAMDGVGNGLFTGSLLRAVKRNPEYNLGQIKTVVGREIGAQQSPSYVYAGPRLATFEKRPAFAL